MHAKRLIDEELSATRHANAIVHLKDKKTLGELALLKRNRRRIAVLKYELETLQQLEQINLIGLPPHP